MDLKKNIAGSHRLLDVLREMSSVVSESKTFHMNESVDINTQKMCALQDSNERTAGTLQMLQLIFGGVLAFQILDRVTGQWSVANSPWFSTFYQSAIQNTPLLWFIISLFMWLLIALIFSSAARRNHYRKQGVTTVRLKVNRRVHIKRLQDFLKSKLHTNEERSYDDHNDIVRVTYIDSIKKDWGGAKPTITIEHDERNRFLLSCTVEYNKRLAKKTLVFTSAELHEKIMNELNGMDVWDIKGEDRSSEDLACDKRAAIEILMENEDLKPTQGPSSMERKL